MNTASSISEPEPTPSSSASPKSRPHLPQPHHAGAVTAVHGITSNTTFDPLFQNQIGWFWYAEQQHARTFWQAAHEAGIVTSNQGFSNQAIPPSPDAISEFKVETDNYSAEYGRSAGAVINVSIRSGTNQFHGKAYDYIRNTVFNAIGPFTPPNNALTGKPQKPSLIRNQFGGTFGGPIFRDKLFFFADYEGTRQIARAITAATVPTLNALQVKAEHRFGNGIYILNSFTWSHAFDNASGHLDTPNSDNSRINLANGGLGERGNSAYNQPINNVLSIVYDLPYGHGRRFGASAPFLLEELLGGWQITAIDNNNSGQPINVVYTANSAQSVSTILPQRPNRIPGVATVIPKAQRVRNAANTQFVGLNINAFTIPTANQPALRQRPAQHCPLRRLP